MSVCVCECVSVCVCVGGGDHWKPLTQAIGHWNDSSYTHATRNLWVIKYRRKPYSWNEDITSKTS